MVVRPPSSFSGGSKRGETAARIRSCSLPGGVDRCTEFHTYASTGWTESQVQMDPSTHVPAPHERRYDSVEG
jgi:hypothetical protein